MLESTRKPNRWRRGCGCCLALLLVAIVLFFILRIWAERVSESTIFLETENLTLVKTYRYSDWLHDRFVRDDPRFERFLEDNNGTAIVLKHTEVNGETITLRENDDFFVLVTARRRGGMNFDPKHKFDNPTRFEFYQVFKAETDMGFHVTETKCLGSIYTNLYGEWRDSFFNRICITPDCRYVLMWTHTVNSRSLGDYRSTEVVLAWEIGDQVSERELVNREGKKTSFTVKTNAELEREIDEEYAEFARTVRPGVLPEHPKNFHATAIDRTSVKLTWDRARFADGYRIFQMMEGGRYWKQLGSTGISEREFTVNELPPNATYYFEIESFNSATGAVSKWKSSARITVP